MWNFIRRHLDPASRLGEILFSLIMALGFTGSVRLGLDEADNRELFLGILGCNLAWAIVDAVMYLMQELFERGRAARLLREVLAMQSEEDALARIAAELAGRIPIVADAPGAEPVHRWLLDVIRNRGPQAVRLRAEDLKAALAVALVIVLSTLPLLVPFLVLPNPDLAARASNTVALVMLFLLGNRWGREVGKSPWKVGFALTGVGVVLVMVTIAMGG